MNDQKELDLRDLFINPEADEILEKVQRFLFDKHNFCKWAKSPEEIWGSNNDIEVPGLCDLFYSLQQDNILPTDLSFHYTQNDTESSYEDMATRYILMDGLKPVFICYFEDMVDLDPENLEFHGVLKEGMKSLIKAVLMYHHYKEPTLG